jgi:nicotinate-nucleotide adenylyltransferase
LGILGGTFDPVHFGHLLLAQSALEQFMLDGVLFVPTAYPFYKQAHLVSDVEERFLMLKLAIGDDQRFQASRAEIDREGPSFTVDTLDILSQVCADKARFFLIVGADALLDLPNWKGAAVLAKQVTVLYTNRPGTSADLARQATIDTEFDIRAIEQPLIEISSSALRARVVEGLSIRYYTPLAAADYFHRSYREHALVNQQVGHCEPEPTSSHPADHHAADPGGQA